MLEFRNTKTLQRNWLHSPRHGIVLIMDGKSPLIATKGFNTKCGTLKEGCYENQVFWYSIKVLREWKRKHSWVHTAKVDWKNTACCHHEHFFLNMLWNLRHFENTDDFHQFKKLRPKFATDRSIHFRHRNAFF